MAIPSLKQRWNNIDVFGLYNGLGIWDSQYKNLKYVRRPFETALDIRNKIFAYHDNPVGVDKQGLLNALSNEFNIEPYNVLYKSVFELSYDPIPSGTYHVSDIFGYYRLESNDEWISLQPQIWSDQYEEHKQSKTGFIVWQNEKYTNDQDSKNFTYSNIVEVLEELPDNTSLKFIYYFKIKDEDDKEQLIQFTDMNNPQDINDIRYTYRLPVSNPSLANDVVIYTLNNIPTNIKDQYYFDNKTGVAKDFVYDLRKKLDDKFKHKWKDIRNATSIWDVHKSYGSGVLPNFFDASVVKPLNYTNNLSIYNNITQNSNLTGGIESLNDSLYLREIIEVEDNDLEHWYPVVFPGKFYINSIPYYLFQKPETINIDLTSGSGIIPSGINIASHSILVLDSYLNETLTIKDDLLPNVFEDWKSSTGEHGDKFYNNIYRRRPCLNSQHGLNINLDIGEYKIDFDNNMIFSNGITTATLIYETEIEYSGVIIEYDINPINNKDLFYDKYFIYLGLSPIVTST